MQEGLRRQPNPRPSHEDAYRLADALVTLGEPRAAVDVMRREVNVARASLPAASLELLHVLEKYARILEDTNTLAEADFIRAEMSEIVDALPFESEEAVDAYLQYGLLLCKMHNYDGAIARLREAVRKVEALENIGMLRRHIVLAQAWRSQAQAFEELGELSEAANAVDVLLSVKRTIRFIVFSASNSPARETGNDGNSD